YSPIRFGVNTAHDSPHSTDSTALLKRIGSKRLQMYLHLIVSNNQFPIIKRKTATKENPTACKSAALISILKSFSASLLESKRYHMTKIKTVAVRRLAAAAFGS